MFFTVKATANGAHYVENVLNRALFTSRAHAGPSYWCLLYRQRVQL